MPALSHPDEEFINKSLLASLDAQADAEPREDQSQSNDHDQINDNLYYDQSKFLPKQSFRTSFTAYPNTTRPRHQNLYPDNFQQSYDSRQTYDYKSYLPDTYNPKPHNPYPSNPQQFGNPVQLSSQTPYGPHVPAISATAAQPVPPGLAPNVALPIQNGPNTTSNGEEISTIFVVGFPEDMQEREFQNMFTFSSGFEAATLKIPNKEYTAYGSLVGGPPGTTIANGLGLRGGAFQYAGPNDPYNLVTVNQGGVVVDGGRDGTMASWPAPTSADDLSNGHYLGAGPGGAAGLGLGPLGLAGAAGMGPASLSLPPRKQIIGFAKFRSREEALAARDILQGRRVDIEKGAVLKAEMAKKNLHTKRGVGPVPGVGVGIGGLQQQQQQQPPSHMNGLNVTGMDAFNTEPTGFSTATSSNRDSLPALARLGWRDSVIQGQGQADSSNPASNALQSNGAHVNGREDEERKRDSLLSIGLGGLSLASTSSAANATGQRGPRERAEDDEWRRKEKEKEMNLMRLRANNAAAFDAFHGVPASVGASANGTGAPGMSRQSSTASTSSGSVVGGGGSGSGLWTAAPTASTVPTESVATSSPMLGDAEVEQRDGEDAKQQQQQQETEDEVVGPWDRFNKGNASYAAVARPVGASGAYSVNGVQHHATESERSTSPAPPVLAPGAFEYQGGVEGGQQQYQSQPVYQPQYLHLHEQQQQAAHQQHLYDQQQQQQQHLYQSMYSHHHYNHQHHQQFRSSQSESSETGSVVGADSSPNANNNNPNVNPIGYVGARLGYATGFGSVVSLSSSSSNARDPVSVSNTAGAATSLSKTPGSGFSFGSMGVGPGMSRSLSSVNGVVGNGAATSSSSTSASAVSPPAGVATSTAAAASTSAIDTAATSAPNASSNVNTNVNGVIGGPAMSSGSSSGGSISGSVNGTGGNTSPQLPSPASAAGSGASVGSGALPPGSTSGSVHVRGTVDQNPPINTLYVGNLPTSPVPLGYSNDYLEETLRALFSAYPGFRKLCFRQKANGPMCFIEFVDVQQATDALKALSGNTLGGIVKNGIRLSYSKNPLGVRTPTSAGGNSGGPTLQQQQQLVQTLNNHHHHHQYNHQQQQQMGPPPSSATSSNSNDAFQDSGAGHMQLQQQQQHRLPTTILRRDSTLSPTSMSSLAQAQTQPPPLYMGGNGSANGSSSGSVNGNNSFFSSPPPRFYTTSPGMPFGVSSSSSTPLTGASSAFIPRSAANGGPGGLFGGFAAGGGAGASSQTTFSPFGISFATHHENAFVPQQQQVPHLPHLSIPGDQHQHQQQPQSLADD
ncbi:hypothetical protein CVT25_001397 [Psilocybe cyanescens]|uniref:RRM domain-containing protein n=1 Tax=Psilocybe cyanescens TaxID=93625 RepID=A0A409VPZ8_PSICY|nr:hypothetical protein CVT25_001397 [Psilocybe cyanescens]